MVSFRTFPLGHIWFHKQAFIFYPLDCQFTNVTFPISLNFWKTVIRQKRTEVNNMSFLPISTYYVISNIITYVNRYSAVGVEDFFLEN